MTTGALSIARYWSADKAAFLVEADPFGGDLAAKLGASPGVGLWSLVADLRYPEKHESQLQAFSEVLPNGVNLVFGFAGRPKEQALDDNVHSRLCGLLKKESAETDVIVDLGRLSPVPCQPQHGLLQACDAVLAFFDASIEGVVGLGHGLAQLKGISTHATVLGVPAFRSGFGSEEISTALALEVLPQLPSDPKGVRALYRSCARASSGSKKLSRWSTHVVQVLTRQAQVDAAECAVVVSADADGKSEGKEDLEVSV